MTDKTKKRRPSLKRIIGILLILGGLVVLLYVPATWAWSYIVQRGLPAEFERQTAAAVSMNQEVLDGLQGAADAEKLRELATVFRSNLQNEQTIARIEIPKIGVNDIVVEGTNEGALLKGPGHLEETPLPGMGGNFAVAGDRVLYGGPFLNLDEVENNDEIIVQTPYGTFRYTVVNKAITVPDDVSMLQPDPGGKELITLITCDPPWDTSHRLIIQGRLDQATIAEIQ